MLFDGERMLDSCFEGDRPLNMFSERGAGPLNTVSLDGSSHP